MLLERPRARRYSFHAMVELAEVQSDTRITEWTSNLSLYGCRVDAKKPLPAGTKVWVRISYRNENFDALGKVAYGHQNAGMGILFTKIEANNQSVLDKWVTVQRGWHPMAWASEVPAV